MRCRAAYGVGAFNAFTTLGFCLVPWLVRRWRSIELAVDHRAHVPAALERLRAILRIP